MASTNTQARADPLFRIDDAEKPLVVNFFLSEVGGSLIDLSGSLLNQLYDMLYLPVDGHERRRKTSLINWCHANVPNARAQVPTEVLKARVMGALAESMRLRQEEADAEEAELAAAVEGLSVKSEQQPMSAAAKEEEAAPPSSAGLMLYDTLQAARQAFELGEYQQALAELAHAQQHVVLVAQRKTVRFVSPTGSGAKEMGGGEAEKEKGKKTKMKEKKNKKAVEVEVEMLQVEHAEALL